MKPISSTQLKEIEFNILLAVAEFCEEHNLTYFLAYGTLIGAVRHEGFIPWDDDVDIMMPRKDYDYLICNFNQCMKDTHYRAIVPFSKHAKHSILKIGDNRTVKTEPEYHYRSGKETGMIDIDVFPLDGVPEEISQYENWYKKLHHLYTAFFVKQRTFKNLNNREKIKTLIKKMHYHYSFTKKEIIKQTQQLHQKFPFDECNYVGCIESCWNSKKNRFKKEWFEEYTLLKFCNHELRAPIGYHEILSQMYGDYMQLPPVEVQVPHHLMNVFWRE